jgi:hypothetical protein
MGSCGIDFEALAILCAPTTPVSKLSIKHVSHQGRGKVMTVDGCMRRAIGGPLVSGAEPTGQGNGERVHTVI